MSSERCAKCGLFLPRQYLNVVILKTAKGKQKGFLCNGCKAFLDKSIKDQEKK